MRTSSSARSPQNRGGLNVVVLCGGDSAEREVSLDSGRCVCDALRSLGHEVQQIDPVRMTVDWERLSACDIVFPMLHGTGGEDGVLQRKLESLGIPFVGSDSAASALTFDKVATRQRLRLAGLPVADGFVVEPSHSIPEAEATARRFGLPLVVKPAAQGSSVGVSIVRDLIAVGPAIRLARGFGEVVLIERYIAGRELTVPVIDGEVFPAIEICPAGEWYDYRAKYEDCGTCYVVGPANIPPLLTSIAMESCAACGVTGISRVDFRVTSAGECFVLEINTIPGMTSHSLVPMSAAARGLSMGQLCEQSMIRAIADFRSEIAPPIAGNGHRNVA